MKYISIITGSDLRLVMGVNYYIKSFISCNDFFENVMVNRVYSGSQILKIDEGEQVPIGQDIGTTEYRIRRGLRSFVRRLLTYKFYPFERFRYEFNLQSVSKRAVKRFIEDLTPCDYIIFEERGVAEYFFKHRKKIKKAATAKTFLVVHSEGDARLSIQPIYSEKVNEKIKRNLYQRRDYVYSHIDKVIYISQKAFNESILPPEKRVYVYNGAQYIELSIAEKINSVLQFICVGNLNGGKGQDKILDALALMEDTILSKLHLTLVGGGNQLEFLKEQVKRYKLDRFVSILGVRNDVPIILKDMDVFIMPSLTEGLSMSAIEAMRAGLFLVLTDTGGNRELCDDSCGLICTREPDNIKKVMCEIIDNNMVNKEQKIHSFNRFTRLFSIESMAKGYEKVLLSI